MPVADALSAAIAALLTRIATVNGAGSYTVDLSNVAEDWPPLHPEVLPSTFLTVDEWDYSRDGEHDLWSYGLVLDVVVTTFQTPAADSTTGRMAKIRAANWDLVQALEADPGLGQKAFDVERIHGKAFHGGQDGVNPFAGIEWQIRVVLQQPGGGA